MNFITRPTNEVAPARFLLSLVVWVALGLVLGTLLQFGLGAAFGIAASDWQTQDATNWSDGKRHIMRTMLMFSHLLGFVAAGILTFWQHYKKDWSKAAGLFLWPSAIHIGFAFLFLFASFPLVTLLQIWNSALPLPEWMQSSEAAMTQMIEALLVTKSPLTVLANVIVVGLIPAIGEELIFRAGLQGTLQRWFKNEHIAVWVAASIFSAIHVQFEGFFPRMFLGLVLGYAYVWSRSLWVPMLLHFFNNAMQVILLYFMGNKIDELGNKEIENMPIWGRLFSVVLFLVVAFVFYRSRSLPVAEKNDLKDEVAEKNLY